MALAMLKPAPWYLADRIKCDRASASFQSLCAIYPGSLSAKQLMGRVDPSWQTNRVISFASLCNQFIKINQVLKVHGWQAERTDGTPDANYWLSPIGG